LIISLCPSIIVYFPDYMAFSSKIFIILCIVIIGLHIWGALYPTHYNWGVHLLAFYDAWAGCIILAVLGMLISQSFRGKAIQITEKLLHPLSKLPSAIIFIASAAFLIALFLLLPAQGLLLGDSKLILLTTSQIPSSSEISANFRNQPLFLVALHVAQDIIEHGGAHHLENVYRAVDVAAGLIFFTVVFIILRSMKLSPAENLLGGIFLLSGAGSQFFFGYIENYSLLYGFTAAYVVAGYLALERKINLVFPVLFFGIITGLHLGALSYAPSVLYLLITTWREKKRGSLITAVTVISASALLFLLGNYGPKQLMTRMMDAATYDFLPLFSAPPHIPYAILSWLHILDWINANLLIVPFAVISSALLLLLNRRDARIKNPPLFFLILTGSCGLLFTFVINPALGMARDWDLIASFFLPAIFLALYLFNEFLQIPERKNVLLMVTAISFFHTAAWIGINSDHERHLRRSEILTNPLFMGKFAQLLYYDRLANAFWEKKDYPKTRDWYERYLAVDSTNPRMAGNLSEVYRRLGDKENTFRMLKQAAKLGSGDAGVYTNLSVEYFLRGDTATAIATGEKSLLLFPNQPQVHANLGTYYIQCKNFAEAYRHFKSSIEEGMRAPYLYKRMADACLGQNDIRQALKFYADYLRLVPNDAEIQQRFIKLSGALSRQPQK